MIIYRKLGDKIGDIINEYDYAHNSVMLSIDANVIPGHTFDGHAKHSVALLPYSYRVVDKNGRKMHQFTIFTWGEDLDQSPSANGGGYSTLELTDAEMEQYIYGITVGTSKE